jgi:hypothetical protein
VFKTFSKGDLPAAVTFQTAESLSEQQRADIWALFEANMAAIYEADGQKWSPKEKRRELFHVRAPCAPAAALSWPMQHRTPDAPDCCCHPRLPPAHPRTRPSTCW